MADSIPLIQQTVSHNNSDTICSQLQKAILSLCEENYSTDIGLEIDGIICISLLNATEQHVVKIHEKLNQGSMYSDDHEHSKDEDLVDLTGEIGNVDENGQSTQPDNSSGIDDGSSAFTRIESNTKLSDQESRLNEPEYDCTSWTKSKLLSDHSPRKLVSKLKKSSMPRGANSEMPRNTFEGEEDAGNFVVVKVEPTDIDEPEQDDHVSENSQEHIYENICDRNDMGSPNISDEHYDTQVNVESSELENAGYFTRLENRNTPIKLEFGESGFLAGKKKRKQSQEICHIKTSHRKTKRSTHHSSNEAYTVDGEFPNTGENSIPPFSDFNSQRFILASEGSVPMASSYHVNLQHSIGRKHKSNQNGNSEWSSKKAKCPDGLSQTERATVDQIQALVAQYDNEQLPEGYCGREAGVDVLEDFPPNTDKFADETVGRQISLMDVEGMSTMFLERGGVREKKFFCKHCGSGFTMRSAKSRHENSTCGFARHECNICKKVFNRSDSKMRHMWKMHGLKTGEFSEMDQSINMNDTSTDM